MNKVNFGCGSIQPDGWFNVDSDPSFLVEGKALHAHTKVLDDGSIDVIVAHCAIQTNEWQSLPFLFKEFHRILTSGGVIRISLPDIAEGFGQFEAGNIDWFPNSEKELPLRFSAWLTWYSTTKTLLTPQALRILLLQAGFESVVEVDFKKTAYSTDEITELDTRARECYFMEARK